MGLFGINMPLWTEKERMRFLRLRHEIIKESDDESIFAWKGMELSPQHDPPRSGGLCSM